MGYYPYLSVSFYYDALSATIRRESSNNYNRKE